MRMWFQQMLTDYNAVALVEEARGQGPVLIAAAGNGFTREYYAT